MNHQDHDHSRRREPGHLAELRPRSRRRWWAAGLAGLTGLALIATSVAASVVGTAGPSLTSAGGPSSSTEDRRSGGGSDPGRGKNEMKPKPERVPCDADKLIAAITLANARGGAVLDLAEKCTYTLTANIDGAGLPAITAPITLNGGKHTTITRAAAVAQFRILTVNVGGDLTLNHLTITGGQTIGDGGGIFVNTGAALTANHSTVTRNIAGSDGTGSSGGIANNGTTAINHSTVSRNTAATSAGGVGNVGLLTIEKSNVTANAANAVNGIGGGVGSFPGSTTSVTRSTISGNSTIGAGGGTGGLSAKVTVTDSAITGNGASNGGAAFAQGGSLTLRHVAVTHNTSVNQGGGLVFQGLNAATVGTIADSKIAHNVANIQNGGGIVNAALNQPSTVYVRDTHITDNQAEFGGGIFNLASQGIDGVVTLVNTKITKNIAVQNGGGIFNLPVGVVNLNPATGTIVIKNRPNNCFNVPGCAG
ncbi:hypothetical protein [Salinispora oceanensis]|uniref:hypothetical protein n=1 Tax=Salinispora oceanensis TaxID=1050199 RepID=UPI0003A7B180|nr:hypothetical protein [Salinispora oceanensis]